MCLTIDWSTRPGAQMGTNMTNILEKPLIRTYQYNAFLESILGIHKDYEEWLSCNYVQIMASKDFNYNTCVIKYLAASIFGCCPLLDSQGDEKKHIMPSLSTYVEYLDGIFRQGYYLYTFVDEYYIPNRVSYQKNHFEHDILLCGREQDNYAYLGYDILGNYTKGTLPAQQLYQAMRIDNPCLLRLSLSNNSYSFNIQKFIFMLKQYVYAEDSTKNLEVYLDMNKYSPIFYDNELNMPLVFGIDVYARLCSLIDFYNETDVPYDWRVLHLLYEHKQSIYQKLEYLMRKGYLERNEALLLQYDAIVAKAKLIENLGLKYQITRAKRVGQEIQKNISEMQKEADILGGVLDLLIQRHGFDKTQQGGSLCAEKW